MRIDDRFPSFMPLIDRGPEPELRLDEEDGEEVSLSLSVTPDEASARVATMPRVPGRPDQIDLSVVINPFRPYRGTELPDTARTKLVPIAALTPRQPYVLGPNVERMLGTPLKQRKPIKVHRDKVRNRLYIADGHNRVVASIARGQGRILATVIDADAPPKMDLSADDVWWDPEAVISLPDIADVKFPAMIGAMPGLPISPSQAKPRRKVRKPVTWKGVHLSRTPTLFEQQVMSLSDIPRRFSTEQDALVTALKTVRLDQTHADAESLSAQSLHASIRSAQARMALYGACEVRKECARQGVQNLSVTEDPADFAPLLYAVEAHPLLARTADRVADRLHGAWLSDRDHVIHRLARTGRKPSKERWASLMEAIAPTGLQNAARQVLNEAFSLGRTLEMTRLCARPISLADDEDRAAKVGDDPEDTTEVLAGQVDYVVQTAILDKATCAACAEADGQVYDYGSDEQADHMPPYVECDGWDNCRCVQLFVLTDGSGWIVRDNTIISIKAIEYPAQWRDHPWR